MEVTRNVILDLLPLYVANEVSMDTRALVAKYLELDPELAQAAKKLATTAKLGEIPVPLSRENQLVAFKEAKRYMFLRTLTWAGVLSFALLVGLALAFLAARSSGHSLHF